MPCGVMRPSRIGKLVLQLLQHLIHVVCSFLNHVDVVIRILPQLVIASAPGACSDNNKRYFQNTFTSGTQYGTSDGRVLHLSFGHLEPTTCVRASPRENGRSFVGNIVTLPRIKCRVHPDTDTRVLVGELVKLVKPRSSARGLVAGINDTAEMRELPIAHFDHCISLCTVDQACALGATRKSNGRLKRDKELLLTVDATVIKM